MQWLPVVGYEAFYEVSDFGEIRSLPRKVGAKNGGTRVRKPKVLSQFRYHDEYAKVQLTSAEGVKTLTKVHLIVTRAFLGPRPDGLCALHWDDDKGNNRLSNLYYGTRSQNQRDAVRNGKHKAVGAHPGERHHLSKLKEVDIPEILRLYEAGMPKRQIGFKFGVTDMTIHDVLNGVTWGWLTGRSVA